MLKRSASISVSLLLLLFLVVASVIAADTAGADMSGDVDGDGWVSVDDLLLVVNGMRAGPQADPRADLNGDGVVDVRDIAIVGRPALGRRRRSQWLQACRFFLVLSASFIDHRSTCQGHVRPDGKPRPLLMALTMASGLWRMSTTWSSPGFTCVWWQRLGSNQRPSAYEAPALPLSYAATVGTRSPVGKRGSGAAWHMAESTTKYTQGPRALST